MHHRVLASKKLDAANVTERLSLQMPALSDLPDMVALWSDPEVVRYIGGRVLSDEEIWQRLLRYRGHWALLGYGYWTVRERGTGAFVGEIGFADWHRPGLPELEGSPEGGWVLPPSMHGKGYASEALDAALAWLDRTVKPSSSACIIAPDNVASLKLAERSGYRLVRKGIYRDSETCILTREHAGPG
ncbi:GNAT family N-acetyltransferase [Sphingomonas adhaesiva]|uniref:GNAT family N-acetyltransferase n=1 Tax=Sphingomonas adhaesiva TaxID=28212 RepID=A0A2A4I6V0_9SPHN|nr:GNAT family N-acetyltransferase [Sphingomonas adhaesiva]PCG14321.1 GNAT family N-acetyltransferase [Sphingomonas adhaesiva]